MSAAPMEGPATIALADILTVAEVFSHSQSEATALEVIERRRNRWFDPDLVNAFRALAADAAFWQSLRRDDVTELVKRAEPARVRIVANESRLNQIADAFASLVLEKPGPLTPDEWVVIKRHPAHTLQILQAVPGFSDFAFDAACHHEKLDGSGYHCGYTGERLSPTARALTVADMADALLTDRPYRPGLDPMEALRIIHADGLAGQLCAESVGALTDYVAEGLTDQSPTDDTLGDNVATHFDDVLDDDRIETLNL